MYSTESPLNVEDEETPEPLTEEVFFHTLISFYEVYLHCICLSLGFLEIEMYSSDDEEVEDEEHGSSTLYAVITLCLFLLSWQSSFRVPDICWSTSGIYAPLSICCHAFRATPHLHRIYQTLLSSSGQWQVSMLTPSQNLSCAHSATQFMIQMQALYLALFCLFLSLIGIL